jgi:plastocyanin/Cu/Ag efflux protein CusF
MKKHLLIAALILLSGPAWAKDYTIQQITDPASGKPYRFEPKRLTIQLGDTVTFVNAQDDLHDVMFVSVPKGVTEMIMGPQQEKTGQSWSYKFTVPGTYQFHCHAHEKLGMAGTLIVGAPSLPGQVQKMDHHKLTAAQESHTGQNTSHTGASVAAAGPEGEGTLNSVDAARHIVNITHKPIKALGWPGMRMDFPLAEGVDVAGLKAGDSVTFTLKADAEENYAITAIRKNN